MTEGPIISGTPEAASFVGRHRDKFYAEADRVKGSKLDIHTGYPELVEAHTTLHEKLPGLYTEAVMDPEFDPKVSLRRLQEFFDMSDAALPFSSASYALGSAIETMTQPGDGIALVRPAWDIYPQLVTDAGDGGRTIVEIDLRVPSQFRDSIKKAEAQGVKIGAIVLNIPRNPDMHTFSPEELEQIIATADEYGITVIYDEVFGFYNPDAHVEEVQDDDGNRTGNKLVHDVQRAQSSVVVRDTGKLLPSPPFPKVALLDMNEGALEKGGNRLTERHNQRHFVDPNVDMRILEKILHDEGLPQLVEDIRSLTDKNSTALREALGSFGVQFRHAGPFAIVPIGEWGMPADYITRYLHELGLDVRKSTDFKTRENFSYIRVPLVKSEDKMQKIAHDLVDKLEGIQTVMRLRGILAAAKQGIYQPSMVDAPDIDQTQS